jgi:hypothetical protein
VNPNGTVGSTLAIASASDNTWLPQIAQRTGDQMTVTLYSDQGAGDPAFDFGVRGQDVDISPLALVGSVYNISSVVNVRERTPAISCASSTSCQVPYRRYDNAQGADRVKYRMLTY